MEARWLILVQSLFFFLLLPHLGAEGLEKVRFDKHRIYSVYVNSTDQLFKLQELENHLEYEFWQSPLDVGMSVEIMVPPQKLKNFEELQTEDGFHAKLMIENLQEKIDNEQPKIKPRTMGWTAYNTLDEIYHWFDQLALIYPDKITVVEGGQTYEGRKIKGVILSTNPNNPGVFLESGMHAREWIGPATTTFILNQLLTSSDPNVKAIAEKYNWYVFPVANPDGYDFTHTTNRMWRKTRSVSKGGCYGADPNRNWGHNWMMGGASSNPCSDTFAGASPFSEIETRTLSAYYSTIADKITTYVSFHSYSQLLLIPYGHTMAHLDNYDDLLRIGYKALLKLRERYGTKYDLGNISETIYIGSGGSVDWVKGEKKTPIVYCYELRDQGDHGFVLPADQIIPTARETLDSIAALLEEATNLGYH